MAQFIGIVINFCIILKYCDINGYNKRITKVYLNKNDENPLTYLVVICVVISIRERDGGWGGGCVICFAVVVQYALRLQGH